MAKHTLGRLGSGRQLPSGYILAKRKKDFRSGRPIISFVDSPFRPMLNILARLIFQLIPTACPNHFATGDVYTLLSILRSAPVDADLILVNQDLAGFFTSIDQDRFIRSWFMLLDFLRPKMNVFDDEAFSVYPGKSNNPGDIIKGRTFRRLNVTRKIVINDVPDLIKSALNMQTFALGQKCVRQSRGSPMGSPLSPALCLMVVSISEQIWSSTFHQLLSNHHLFIRHIRYVDNRLIFGDKRLTTFAPYEVLLDEGFYGKPIILETEPDQEFLSFMLETKPLELIYQGPTNISQVLSPFSASPPKVLLSGFRSRCHIVIKGAFPDFRVQQGLSQLIHLYTRAGFPKEELQTISNQLLIQHQNMKSPDQTCACSLLVLFVLVGVLFVSCCLFVFVVAFWQLLGSTTASTLSLLRFSSHGSCSRPCLSSPPGSGHYASQPPGGASPLFRAIHRVGRLFTSVTFPLRTSNIQRPPHFCSFTSVFASTNHGVTWRNPVPCLINPEPNLGPTTAHPAQGRDSEPMSTTAVTPRIPVLMADPGPDPIPGTSTVTEPFRVVSRPTIPVPVRSKQRASSTVDPQPKKKQKGESIPESRVTTAPGGGHPGPLPITSEAPSGGPNSDDSDCDAASGAASTHHPVATLNYHHGTAANTISTTPPGTSTLTLTPNPKAPPSPTFRVVQPNPADPPPFRPWTNADDQELISMKQDTKSCPSWKTIGSRLHRDSQVCKMRWGILKQMPGVMDQHGRMNPPQEPEAED